MDVYGMSPSPAGSLAPHDLDATPSLTPSNQLARLLEVEARRARMELARIAVTEVAKEIRFDRRPREERRVHLGVVEARHRAAVEPQRPGGQHEVRALQRRVPQRDVL